VTLAKLSSWSRMTLSSPAIPIELSVWPMGTSFPTHPTPTLSKPAHPGLTQMQFKHTPATWILPQDHGFAVTLFFSGKTFTAFPKLILGFVARIQNGIKLLVTERSASARQV
jgi:hypothetical protein